MIQSFKEAHAAWLTAEANIARLEINGCPDTEMSAAIDTLNAAEWGIIQALPPKIEPETAELALFVVYVQGKYSNCVSGLGTAALGKLVSYLCERAL